MQSQTHKKWPGFVTSCWATKGQDSAFEVGDHYHINLSWSSAVPWVSPPPPSGSGWRCQFVHRRRTELGNWLGHVHSCLYRQFNNPNSKETVLEKMKGHTNNQTYFSAHTGGQRCLKLHIHTYPACSCNERWESFRAQLKASEKSFRRGFACSHSNSLVIYSLIYLHIAPPFEWFINVFTLIHWQRIRSRSYCDFDFSFT